MSPTSATPDQSPVQPEISRRAVLMAGAGAAAAGAVLAVDNPANAASKHFVHGVASGDPRPRSVILWTRVTPVAAAKAGSGAGPKVTVRWEVARDRHFQHVVRRGTFRTGPQRDHTVKLEVRGLSAATDYHYRFHYAGSVSRVGRTRTAPALNATPHNIRLGVVSCANLQAGWFSAYRHLARRNDLDAIVHLGDYIYEYGPGEYGYGQNNKDIRHHRPAHEILSLKDYRQRHAQYKKDADLQDLHARYPIIATWDDHEVADDQWKNGAVNHQADEGNYHARRRRAHRAYDEWMPTRLGGTTKTGDGYRMYRRFRFGTLAELSMMDLRSYRSKQSAPPYTTASDADRTITGKKQMKWLKKRLVQKQTQWKLVGNPVMIAPVVFPPLPDDVTAAIRGITGTLPQDGVPYNVDQWDGYTHDRHEVFEHLADHSVTDAVFLTGDIHSGWACDLPLDAGTYPVTPSVATEFVCTSITSNNLDDITGTPPRTSSLAVEASIQSSNRHIKYLNFDDHGYSVLDVTAKRVQMDYFIISDRADRKAKATWTASWATKAGTQKVHAVDSPVKHS